MFKIKADNWILKRLMMGEMRGGNFDLYRGDGKLIHKKIQEIRINPKHKYKHLHKPLQNFYGVHIDTSFVLIFTIDPAHEVVEIYYFAHHDTVYDWRP